MKSVYKIEGMPVYESASGGGVMILDKYGNKGGVGLQVALYSIRTALRKDSIETKKEIEFKNWGSAKQLQKKPECILNWHQACLALGVQFRNWVSRMAPKPFRRKQGYLIDKSFQYDSFKNDDDSQLGLASDLHKSGNLEEAKIIYEKLLKNYPKKFEILHLLGTLEAQNGNYQRAINLLSKAIKINPNLRDTHSNLGNALIELNRFELATQSYDKAIKINPNIANDYCHRGFAFYRLQNYEEALFNILIALKIKPNYVQALLHCANIQMAMGQIKEAIVTSEKAIFFEPNNQLCHLSCANAYVADLRYLDALLNYDSVIKINSKSAEAFLCRGDVLVKLDRKNEAIKSYTKSIDINSKNPITHFNLGLALTDLGEHDAALRSLKISISLDPSLAEALAAIGVVSGKVGRLQEAYEYLSKAIIINPKECSFYINRGNILSALKKFDESLLDYDKAIELRPDYEYAFLNRGYVLLAYLNKAEAALVYFEVALALKPDFVPALINSAEAFNRIGELDKALEFFLKALEIDPEAPYIIGKCLHYKMKLCDWSNFEEGISIYESLLSRNVLAAVPFEPLNFTDNPLLHLKVAKLTTNYNNKLYNLVEEAFLRKPNKILKIGYYSADLYYHPVSIWLAEQLENHDKSKVELFVFCLKSVQDPMRNRLEAAVDHWIDVENLSDLEVAKLSRKLSIDIAIDLNGHTALGRPGIFAIRSAPIQVSHLGFPGSMGAEYIDYMFGHTPSPDEDLEELATYRQFISEKIAYVPSGYTYDRQRQLTDQHLTRAQFGLPETGFVFTCQNGCQKLTPEVFDIWMEILNAVPGSVLWLLKPNDTAVKNLLKEANARGVDSERLIFTAREAVPIDQERARIGRYLSSYKLADLFLDTWPYNAGTTAIDALWAGLPVLTKMGKAYVARMATEALRAIEVPELITRTPQDYKELAIQLAHNPERLKQLKEKVQRNRLTSALFDPVGNTRHIENAYLEMYRRYQAGLKPEDFFVRS